VAENFADEANVVIAKVDADAETGKATAAEYGVSGYPTIKFFPAGSTTPEDYNGGRSEDAFVAFLNEKAGTHRAVGGGVDSTAGTVAALDSIVAKILSGTALAEAAAEAKKAVESFTDKVQAQWGAYYLRVFDKLSKNQDYVSKELARLQSIIGKGGLASTKLDELVSKTNVLRKFVAKAPAAEEKEGKEEL
jgi:protein disulfide-isomerase A6